MIAHPSWCLCDPRGVEIERRADPNQNRHGQPLAVLEHPTLLLGSAQSNPDNVRVCAFDGLDDFAILLRRQRAKRRAVCARHYQVGKAGDKSRSKILCHTWPAAVKKVPITFCCGLLAEYGHQFGSIDAASHVETMSAADPYQRHPVLNDKPRRIQNRL